MSILSDQLVMSERVLRQEQVESVTLDTADFNRFGEATAARQANSQRRFKTGSLGLNGFYWDGEDGNKYPDNRQTIDGAGTVGKDGFGYETINDSKVAGLISNPASVGVITQTWGYEDIIDHHQMYTAGEWKNEGIYGV